jgi:hypothetical protein
MQSIQSLAFIIDKIRQNLLFNACELLLVNNNEIIADLIKQIFKSMNVETTLNNNFFVKFIPPSFSSLCNSIMDELDLIEQIDDYEENAHSFLEIAKCAMAAHDLVISQSSSSHHSNSYIEPFHNSSAHQPRQFNLQHSGKSHNKKHKSKNSKHHRSDHSVNSLSNQKYDDHSHHLQ